MQLRAILSNFIQLSFFYITLYNFENRMQPYTTLNLVMTDSPAAGKVRETEKSRQTGAHSAIMETKGIFHCKGNIVRQEVATMSVVAVQKTLSDDYEGIKAAVDKVIEDIGGLEDIIKPGYKVLIKPNFVAKPTDRLSGAITRWEVCKAIWEAVKAVGGDPFIAESACAGARTDEVIEFCEYTKLIEEGIRHKGFSVIECASICPTYYGRKNKKGDAVEMLMEQKERGMLKAAYDKLPDEKKVEHYPIGTLTEYDYPEFHLSMACFPATVRQGELVLKEHEAARWLRKDELDDVPWLPADRIVVDLLKTL